MSLDHEDRVRCSVKRRLPQAALLPRAHGDMLFLPHALPQLDQLLPAMETPHLGEDAVFQFDRLKEVRVAEQHLGHDRVGEVPSPVDHVPPERHDVTRRCEHTPSSSRV